MVKIEEMPDVDKKRQKETNRLADIVKEVVGERYAVTPHFWSITVSRAGRFMDYPISIFPSFQRVDVTDPDVFADAYRIAERLEKETPGKEYTVKQNYEENTNSVIK